MRARPRLRERRRGEVSWSWNTSLNYSLIILQRLTLLLSVPLSMRLCVSAWVREKERNVCEWVHEWEEERKNACVRACVHAWRGRGGGESN